MIHWMPAEAPVAPVLRDRHDISDRFKWNLKDIFEDWTSWKAAYDELAQYRFAVEDLYRQQEHVLDDKGEHLLSLASRFSSTPNDAYAALSTADIKYPTIPLSTGAEVTLTYGQYRAILATNRN